MMDKKILMLEVGKIGRNEIVENFTKLNSFVFDNYDALFEGALRLGKTKKTIMSTKRTIEIGRCMFIDSFGTTLFGVNGAPKSPSLMDDNDIEEIYNCISTLLESYKKGTKSDIILKFGRKSVSKTLKSITHTMIDSIKQSISIIFKR